MSLTDKHKVKRQRLDRICEARSPPTLLPLSTYWSINSHSIGLIFSLHRGACQIHHAGDCMNVSLISRLLSGGEGDYATGGAVVSASLEPRLPHPPTHATPRKPLPIHSARPTPDPASSQPGPGRKRQPRGSFKV
ncbi:unnamed protein product [Gadus morhua 'NCC']